MSPGDREGPERRLAEVVRDWAALLYTPVLTVYAVWVTALLVWAYPWSEQSETLRLDFLGAALIGALCLIGLGTLFYQRRPPPHIRARGGSMEFELSESACAAPEGERPAPEGRGRGRRGPGLDAGGSSRRAQSTRCTAR